MDYVVYTYLDPREPGTWNYNGLSFNHKPFYVGKGKPDRPYILRGRSAHVRNKIRSIAKSGQQHITKILHQNLSNEHACKLETQYIRGVGRNDLDAGPLLNYTDGGEGSPGRILSEESKRKLADGTKHHIETHGHQKGFLGKHHSKATRKRMSESAMGNKRSLGFKHTPETIQKMSKAQSNRTVQPHAGKVHSEEAKAKIRKSCERYTYEVTHPNGKQETITNLRGFCREHGLTAPLMIAVINGKAKHHKQFTIRKIQPKKTQDETHRPE